MARKKNQVARRQQLLDAAFSTLAQHGTGGTRVSGIAAAAGVSTGSVSYYFPSKDDLLLEATRRDIDDFYHSVVERLREMDDPLEKLEAMIRWTLPDENGHAGWVVLFQFWSRAIYNAPLAALAALFQERARLLYMSVLEEGQARGVFRLVSDAETVARSLMAMIDGLSFQIILRDPTLTVAEAEQMCLEFVRRAVAATSSETDT